MNRILAIGRLVGGTWEVEDSVTKKKPRWDKEKMEEHHRSRLVELLDGPRIGEAWHGWANRDFYLDKGWVQYRVTNKQTWEAAEFSLTPQGRAYLEEHA
jgi:hypothetical protein